MQNMNYEIVKIENGFLLYKSELGIPLKIVHYEDFDTALADLQTILIANFAALQQTVLDNNKPYNLLINIKND